MSWEFYEDEKNQYMLEIDVLKNVSQKNWVSWGVLLWVSKRQPDTLLQGLSRLCVQRVIWTLRTLFFDSLDTQRFMSEFADDDFS